MARRHDGVRSWSDGYERPFEDDLGQRFCFDSPRHLHDHEDRLVSRRRILPRPESRKERSIGERSPKLIA
jgi:hypothetical protein